MFKKIIYIILCCALFIGFNFDSVKNYNSSEPVSFSDITENYVWAKPAIDALSEQGVLNGISEGIFAPSLGVSKEQLAKMLTTVFSLPQKKSAGQTYTDVAKDRWSYPYIEATSEFFPLNYPANEFNPTLHCTRELLASVVANAIGLEPSDNEFLNESFIDAQDAASETAGLLSSAAKAGIISGSDGYLYPQKNVTRAEAAVILLRALDYKEQGKISENGQTSILGASQISLEQAIRWAKNRDADECFINIAPIYWEYGEKTGIRPEVLYAQAAKETNYGKYTGNVQPHQNNWAGIKTVMASGDKAEDHETFESADDGVRGHFNHMCAYVGLAPIGTPHERFNSTASAAWAGTVRYVEELSGKWAPATDYGTSIVTNYMKPMSEA